MSLPDLSRYDVGHLAPALRALNLPAAQVVLAGDGDWVEATFRLPGGNVTLALPLAVATPGAFWRLYTRAVGAPEPE